MSKFAKSLFGQPHKMRNMLKYVYVLRFMYFLLYSFFNPLDTIHEASIDLDHRQVNFTKHLLLNKKICRKEVIRFFKNRNVIKTHKRIQNAHRVHFKLIYYFLTVDFLSQVGSFDKLSLHKKWG